MTDSPLVLGIDLGTSGIRTAVVAANGAVLDSRSQAYGGDFANPHSWREGCGDLIRAIPAQLRSRLQALAVDGTSGTLLACDRDGSPLGKALAYSQSCPEHQPALQPLVDPGSPAASCSGSLARALRLLNCHGEAILLRHQADWISGWLLNDWRWGEEGNNLRLGWDLITNSWPARFAEQSWRQALPEIRPSGSILGTIAPEQAKALGLENDLIVVAGTTDSNAAVLAADPGPGDGITVLGTTLVMKCFTETPLHAPGVTSHRVGGRWLCGGASNAGAGVLRRFYSDDQLSELSRQINPNTDSGLRLRPLPAPGERFPVDDPELLPVLEPRPVSDALYLHGLLEGLAEIEAQGWQRLNELGAAAPRRIISIGGGARNPQWRRLRERRLGCAVTSCQTPPAAGVARLAQQALVG